MKTRFVFVGAMLAAVACTRPAVAQQPSVEPSPIEAESASLGQIKEDPGASGGRYVTGAPLTPLFHTKVSSDGGQFTIWARVRDCDLIVRSNGTDGTAKNLAQQTQKLSPQWTWQSLGTYDRSQLGSEITLLRGKKGGADAGLDAVILSANPDFDPNHPKRSEAAAP